jgi:hypothetical protein
MKKFFIVLLFIALIIVGFMIYSDYKATHKTPDQIVDSRLDESQKQLDEANSKLDEIKQQEYKNTLRKLELAKLQNPEILNKAFEKVGKLTTYEGKSQYSDIIKEKSFWGSKSLDLTLIYNFGIAIDLNTIVVESFFEKTVVLQIPKSELKLQYIEVNTKDTKVISTKTWLAKNYNANDMKLVLDNAQDKTKESIEGSKDIFDKAMESLKESLKEFILKLGYDDVIFNIVK